MFGVDLKGEDLIAAKASVPHANFARASSDWLPFPSQCFDFVAARVALPYMHIPTALAEMARVLKPGGSVWLTLHPFSLVSSWLLQDLLALQPKWVRLWLWAMVTGAFFHVTGRQLRYRSRRVLQETFQTERSTRRGLRAAGFEQVRISRGCHFVVVAIKAQSL
jgi:ubiquinone/menaquinone biosynthesis C-methylase UbiE